MIVTVWPLRVVLEASQLLFIQQQLIPKLPSIDGSAIYLPENFLTQEQFQVFTTALYKHFLGFHCSVFSTHGVAIRE